MTRHRPSHHARGTSSAWTGMFIIALALILAGIGVAAATYDPYTPGVGVSTFAWITTLSGAALAGISIGHLR